MSESHAVMATLIADASFCPSTKQAAWAGRIIFSQQRATYTGTRFLPHGSSNDAELIAVVDTLEQAWRSKSVGHKAGVLFQTDNAHVVRLLNHHFENVTHRNWPPSPPRTSALQEETLAQLRRLFKEMEPDWVFARHVKGHVPHAQRAARQHVQESMDGLARATRQGLRPR